MPYEITWVDAELFLEHNDMCIYHIYKDDDIDNRREYHYCTNPKGRDSEGVEWGVFDVRDLKAWTDNPGDIAGAIRAAIESSELSLLTGGNY
jgi:hypothetical protein